MKPYQLYIGFVSNLFSLAATSFVQTIEIDKMGQQWKNYFGKLIVFLTWHYYALCFEEEFEKFLFKGVFKVKI